MKNSLSRIYSCKMYIKSSRKEKIRANLIDPINSELVIQLEDALSDSEEEIEEIDETAQISELGSDDYIDDNDSASSNSDETIPADDVPKSVHIDLEPVRRLRISKIKKTTEVYNAADEEKSTVSESKRINRKPLKIVSTKSPKNNINSATNTSGIPIAPAYGINNILRPAEIKGILNADTETAGVKKVSKDDDELLIYYKEDVNLNDVMGKAIDRLDASSHNTMEFDKLNRNENAIVFKIITKDEE